LEIDIWIRVTDVTNDEGYLDYSIEFIKVWSDRNDSFVSPSKKLQQYIENELYKYPKFIEDMDELASSEAQLKFECHQDYLFECERDRRMGL